MKFSVVVVLTLVVVAVFALPFEERFEDAEPFAEDQDYGLKAMNQDYQDEPNLANQDYANFEAANRRRGGRRKSSQRWIPWARFGMDAIDRATEIGCRFGNCQGKKKK